mmetsp:Transcript_19969/g.22981  ORF Transcript_19969/g.22981 Transcript_19969/m.22981 type:complete len:516 (+) Transcript_19969:50-1597(+)
MSDTDTHQAENHPSSSPALKDESKVTLFQKVYSHLPFQNMIHSTTQAIKQKYDGIVTTSHQQLTNLIKFGEDALMNTTERIRTWCYDITIYNHLIGMWLVQNLSEFPETQQIVSYQEFSESFLNLVRDDSEELEKTIQNLYKQASIEWKKLDNPNLDDIKRACILIAARTIADDYEVEEGDFAISLVNFFDIIDSKKIDSVTEEAFYHHVLRIMKSKPSNVLTLRRASEVFYIFAKRFAFIEFPLTFANQNTFRVLAKFVKEKFDTTGELFLTKVDRSINFLLRKLQIEFEDSKEPMNLIDRFHSIMQKLSIVVSGCLNKASFAIQNTKGYKLSANYINYEKRRNDFIAVTEQIVKLSNTLLGPAYNAVSYTYDNMARKYVVALCDVSSSILKKRITALQQKYSILKEATIKLKDHVLEIEISKETFEKLGKNAKAQIGLLYEEIRNINYAKLKVFGSHAYRKAVETVRRKIKTNAIESNNKEESKPVNEKAIESEEEKVNEADKSEKKEAEEQS